MAQPEKLLRFYRSEWPVFVPSVAALADDLRHAIGARDWEQAIDTSMRLGATAGEVIGMARTVSADEQRPSVDELQKFDGISRHPLLDLGLPSDRWAQVVSDFAFLRLGVGWSLPADLIAVAQAGEPLGWRALIEELEAPGRHPEFRDAEDYSGFSNLRQLTQEPWPAPAGREMSVARLSEDARFVVAILGGLRRRRVEELRMAAHTVKLPEHRFVAAFEELAEAGLAEYPASFRSLALELTGADLKALAADAGVKRTGTKPEILDRLVDDHADAIAQAINARGWYHPISIGPVADDFSHLRHMGSLWSSLLEFVEVGDEDAPAVDNAAELFGDAFSDDPPPRASWTARMPTTVSDSATSDAGITLLTVDGRVRQLTFAGEETWEVALDAIKPDYSSGLVQTDKGLLVMTRRGMTLLDLVTAESTWSWPMGEQVVQQPTVADNVVLAVTANGLRAAEIGGNEQWRLDRKRLGPPAVTDGVVIVVRAGEMLMALDVESGGLRWRRRIDDLRTWAPVVSEGVVLLSGYVSGQWHYLALEASTGEELWSHRSDRPSRARNVPTVVRAALNSASADPAQWHRRDILESFTWLLDPDAADRHVVSRAEALCPPGWRVLGSSGEHHVIAFRSTVCGISSSPVSLARKSPTGGVASIDLRPAWTADFDGHPPSSNRGMRAIDLDEMCIVVAAGLSVIALDRASGALRWETEVVAEAVVCAGQVCLALYDDSVKELDMTDGQLLWEVERGSEIVALSFDADSVFLLGSDGAVCSLDARTGQTNWEVRAGGLSEWRSTEDEWAIDVLDGVVVWKLPDGSRLAADVVSGVLTESGDVDLASVGWDSRWLDPHDGQRWDTERRSRDGRFSLFTSGPSWDAGHRGMLELPSGTSIDLDSGFNFDDADAAGDDFGIALLAGRLTDFDSDESQPADNDLRVWLFGR